MLCLTPVLQLRHNVSLIRWCCGLLPCYCPDTMYASSGDLVPYSQFTAQTQCTPHQVTLWLTSLLLPRHSVCLIRWCSALFLFYSPDTMYASSGDLVPYSQFTAQTQCTPHQVTLWLTPLLLPRHNVSLTWWLCGLLPCNCHVSVSLSSSFWLKFI